MMEKRIPPLREKLNLNPKNIMGKYKIYEDDKHHLGLINEDGTRKTPAVYDEIKILEGSYWLCRAYNNWDYFYPCDGTFSVKERNGEIIGSNGKSVNNNAPTSLEDREIYDSLKPAPAPDDGFVHTYQNGKYGLNREDGTIILPAIYDELSIWENANVIHVRLEDKHFYFNDKGENILTDLPNFLEDGIPYNDGLGWHTILIREIVDEKKDNHTYESKVGLVRINREQPKTIAKQLAESCERIPINQEAINMLTDQYSYEFGANIVRLKTDNQGNISEQEWLKALDKLDMLCSFQNSWYYIDKFLSNSKTLISTKSLYWLRHRYDMEYEVIGKPCFAYGIDETLADGEVKWIHVEYYNEHCFPEDYGVSDVMNEGTLAQLKNLIEAHDWEEQGDPYGGCFFGYRNIEYSENRSWEETEKILEYMYKLGHNPEDLTKRVVSMVRFLCCISGKGLIIKDKMLFWEKCAEWSLSRSPFPNKLDEGETCYDEYLDTYTYIDNKTEDIQNRVKQLDNKFLAHGALTGKQLAEQIERNINSMDVSYDYSIVETW